MSGPPPRRQRPTSSVIECDCSTVTRTWSGPVGSPSVTHLWPMGHTPMLHDSHSAWCNATSAPTGPQRRTQWHRVNLSWHRYFRLRCVGAHRTVTDSQTTPKTNPHLSCTRLNHKERYWLRARAASCHGRRMVQAQRAKRRGCALDRDDRAGASGPKSAPRAPRRSNKEGNRT